MIIDIREEGSSPGNKREVGLWTRFLAIIQPGLLTIVRLREQALATDL